MREEVRRLLAEDRLAGGMRPLAEYQNRFPGRWDVVAEEYRAALEAAAPPGEEEGGTRIGPYHVLREIGRGGMGVVYEARDTRLPRRVALKVLAPQYASSEALRLRFEREAALAARLDHPHLCTVFEAGESAGTAWIAMRFVEGRPLSDLIADSRGSARDSAVVSLDTPVGSAAPAPPAAAAPRTTLAESRASVDRVLVLFGKAALALHHAHEKGLFHRDVKPHNIMVTPAGEPVVLDFGLAREEEGEANTLTRTGHLMGTPAYMSPEQLTAQRIALDRRTDVYSLGASLYEALTLRLPFDAPTADKLYQKILSTDPEDPRRLNPALPEDLGVVLETALEKDRERRYQTALALAEDIARVRAREPVRARPAGRVLRLRRWAERNPATAAAAGSLFLALAAGLGLSLHLLGEARAERDAKEAALGEAESARRAAEAARAETEGALRRARALGLASASAEAEKSDPVLGLHLALEAARAERLPPVLMRLHGALAASRERACLEHGAGVADLRWSPAGDRVVTACDDGKARLFDRTGRPVAVLEGHEGPVTVVLCAAGGDRILTASGDGTARLWDAGGRAVAVLRGHAAGIHCAAALPGGGWATGSGDGTVRLWTAEGAEGPVLRGHEGAVLALAVAPDGKTLASGGADRTVRYWDREGRERAAVRESGAVAVLSFSPAGDRLVAACSPVKSDHAGSSRTPLPVEARLLDLEGRVLATLAEAVNVYTDAAWSPDGSLLATLNDEGSVALWEPGGRRIRKMDIHHHSPGNLAFSPDGSLLLAGGGDDALHLWTREGEEHAVLRGHRGAPRVVRFSPDGASIASGSADGTARIWDLHPGEIAAAAPLGTREGLRVAADGRGERVVLFPFRGREARILDGLGAPVADVRGLGFELVLAAFPLHGRTLVLLGMDGTLEVRDGDSGRILGGLPPPGGASPRRLAFSPEAGLIAAADPDGTIRILGADGSLLPAPEARLPGPPAGLAWDPAGTRLLGAAGKEVRVFDARGVPLGSFPYPEGARGLWASPAGDRLLSLVPEGAMLFDYEGRRTALLGGHVRPLRRAAFSADGRRIATPGMDLTVRVFDADGGLRTVLRGHRGEVFEAWFLPDGERVLTWGAGDALRLFDGEGRLLDEIRPQGAGLRDVDPAGDFSRIFTTDEAGVLRVMTLDPEELLRIAAGRLPRPLDPADRERYAGLLGQ